MNSGQHFTKNTCKIEAKSNISLQQPGKCIVSCDALALTCRPNFFIQIIQLEAQNEKEQHVHVGFMLLIWKEPQ